MGHSIGMGCNISMRHSIVMECTISMGGHITMGCCIRMRYLIAMECYIRMGSHQDGVSYCNGASQLTSLTTDPLNPRPQDLCIVPLSLLLAIFFDLGESYLHVMRQPVQQCTPEFGTSFKTPLECLTLLWFQRITSTDAVIQTFPSFAGEIFTFEGIPTLISGYNQCRYGHRSLVHPWQIHLNA